MQNKIFVFLTNLMVLVIFAATPAFAHVVVKPQEVGIGAFQTFTVGVPNERDNPTTQVRLVLPEGLEHVSPNVKPGWTIAVQRSGEEEDAPVTEITWSGGSIPEGQRDDFYFSAKVPAEETTLTWKAYQTYEDGTEVAWEVAPDQTAEDEENKGPASQTKIINDLATEDGTSEESRQNSLPLLLSTLALIFSAAALIRAQK